MAGVWSGYLTFGLVTLPVRLYSGARGQRVGFHLLHDKDHVRLKQQMYCPADEQVVPRSDMVRGYEYAKDEYVIVGDEEIKKAAPHTQKQLEIIEFCHAEEIDPIWFESSYYLMPEAAGMRPYALLERAMEESGYVALAKLSMHNREYAAVIRPSHLEGVPLEEVPEEEAEEAQPPKRKAGVKGEAAHRGTQQRRSAGLVLHTMYYADEIRVVESFGRAAAGVEPREAELRLAEQLIHGLAAPFDPTRFEDTYRKNLEALVAAKIEGRPVQAPEKPRKLAPVTDLMESLKRSLESVPKRPAAGEHPAAKRPAASARGARSRRKVA